MKTIQHKPFKSFYTAGFMFILLVGIACLGLTDCFEFWNVLSQELHEELHKLNTMTVSTGSY